MGFFCVDLPLNFFLSWCLAQTTLSLDSGPRVQA